MICLIDDGIALHELPTLAIAGGINFSGEGPVDQFWREGRSHGSSMALTILSECPQAQIFVVRLLDRYGNLHDRERLTGVFAWLERHHQALGIDMVCAPLADLSHETSDAAYRDTALRVHIAALRERRVATLMPAGNWLDFEDRSQVPGMAWPAILREVVSVGALDGEVGMLALHRTTKRLHASVASGCATSLFARPGAPGETSGATATATGAMAAMRRRNPLSIAALIKTMTEPGKDQDGQTWPILKYR